VLCVKIGFASGFFRHAGTNSESFREWIDRSAIQIKGFYANCANCREFLFAEFNSCEFVKLASKRPGFFARFVHPP
jgi:hypothetical protein